MGRTTGKPLVADAICIGLITLVTALPYVGSIGFYSDDWGLVGEFLQGRTSFADILGDYPGRPIQGAYILLLFKAFGLNPLGYHIVNTIVLGLCAIGLFALLLRLRFSRTSAFATTVIFLVLPQLSTIRVWVATVQVPLSMLAALASMHAQISFMETRRRAWILWAVAAAVISALSYEIFAALILCFPIGLLLSRPNFSFRKIPRETLFLGIAILSAIALIVVVKLAISDRIEPISKLYPYLSVPLRAFDPHFDWHTESGPNLFAGFNVYVWQTLIGWVRAFVATVTARAGLAPILAALAAGGLTLWRLRSEPPSRPGRLALAGVAVFLLGHVLFLVVGGFLLSPTGLSNRVTMAAMPGFAMLLVALLIWAAWLVPEPRRALAFSCGVAVLVCVATTRLAIIENSWVDASDRQQVILSAAKRDLAAVPEGSTVILDGVCPYTGPGVVFETSWDVGPALSIVLDRQLAGDILTERASVNEKGLETSLYGERTAYAYGTRLYVYRPHDHRVAHLTDAADARAYFSGRTPPDCPVSYPGQGELI